MELPRFVELKNQDGCWVPVHHASRQEKLLRIVYLALLGGVGLALYRAYFTHLFLASGRGLALWVADLTIGLGFLPAMAGITIYSLFMRRLRTSRERIAFYGCLFGGSAILLAAYTLLVPWLASHWFTWPLSVAFGAILVPIATFYFINFARSVGGVAETSVKNGRSENNDTPHR